MNIRRIGRHGFSMLIDVDKCLPTIGHALRFINVQCLLNRHFIPFMAGILKRQLDFNRQVICQAVL